MQKFKFLFALLAICLLPVPAGAQASSSSSSNRRTMAAASLGEGESITLDGRLDEGVWARAVPAKDFIQQDPDNGAPATERTEVRIVFTREALYMGVTCFDSEPDRVIGFQRRRDELIEADDKFAWIIDTYLDGRTSYYFDMTPAGLMGDAVLGTGGMVGTRDWNGIWDARARRSEVGWTLEIELPFKTLNFNPNSDTWGINFGRTIRRKNEETMWMGWGRSQRLLNPAFAGRVTGIQNPSQGLGLDVKPYGLVSNQASPGRDDPRAGNDAQFGVDLFYNPTPGLRANLTVNTDFAQTEVDQRLVNLSRFSLFFPEKRDFFLEGSLFFDFGSVTLGGRDNAIVPFFSRRIGLDENGQPQKIDVGAKLTGQAGREDIGVLQVRTGDSTTGPGEDFTVLRLKHRILRASYIGALYTRRATHDSAVTDRQTAGVDFLNQTFIGSKVLNAGGFYLNTTNPAGTGKSAAYGVAVDYPNDFVIGSFVFREVQDNYDPAVGFTLRTGFRRVNPALSINPRPRNHRFIRRLSFGVDANLLLDAEDNSLLNRDWNFTPFQLELHSQDRVQVNVFRNYERLERDFRINRTITLPIGNEYNFTRYRISASTAQKRKLTLSHTTELGGFYSGNRQRLSLDLNVRVRTGLTFAVASEWNRVRLAEGGFETRLYRVISETQLSPWISVVNTVQYDSVSAVLGWQSRFRWIVTPGNDLYVVYTHNWLDDPSLDRFATVDRRAASKFVYTHRF